VLVAKEVHYYAASRTLMDNFWKSRPWSIEWKWATWWLWRRLATLFGPWKGRARAPLVQAFDPKKSTSKQVPWMIQALSPRYLTASTEQPHMANTFNTLPLLLQYPLNNLVAQPECT
jgi:hypothetical protein